MVGLSKPWRQRALPALRSRPLSVPTINLGGCRRLDRAQPDFNSTRRVRGKARLQQAQAAQALEASLRSLGQQTLPSRGPEIWDSPHLQLLAGFGCFWDITSSALVGLLSFRPFEPRATQLHQLRSQRGTWTEPHQIQPEELQSHIAIGYAVPGQAHNTVRAASQLTLDC